MALNNHIAQTSVDFNGLAELRRSATVDKTDQETLEQVAGQFESLFVSMMLKSMRQAKLAEGLFESSQSETYRDMADQQLAMDLSAKGGIGLRDVIMRQLSGDVGNKVSTQSELIDDSIANNIDRVPVRPALQAIQKVMPQPSPEAFVEATTNTTVAPTQAIDNVDPTQAQPITFTSPQHFVDTLWPMAQRAAEKLGVTPEVILSQAALETGWGKHVINHADGQSSFNLFNIKADSRWQGDKASVGTNEYYNGVMIREQAQFRSYDSYQDSFNDYVEFLQTQPRYQNALEHTDNAEQFIEELHKSGYATDPDYADKIKRIMNGDTLAQISQRQSYS